MEGSGESIGHLDLSTDASVQNAINTYQESNQWSKKQELSEQSNRVSNLFIDMTELKKISWQNERIQHQEEETKLKLQIEGLRSELQLKEEQNAETFSRFAEINAQQLIERENLDSMMRNNSELLHLYKTNSEDFYSVAVDLHEQKDAQESIIRDTKRVIIDVQHEMEQERTKYMEDLRKKDVRIAELQEELDKANILPRSTYGVELDVTDKEFLILSSAVGQTSQLLKGGQSLTSLTCEHTRLAEELAKAKETNRQLELSMKNFVDEIEERVSHFQQKKVLDRKFDLNTRIQKQLTKAKEEHPQLVSQRDTGNKKLAFIRAELEKYQENYATLSRQVQHLLFVLEKERSGRDSESPPFDADEDRQLFNNIVQLQKRNMQLESELTRERASAIQAALMTKNAELEGALRDLEASKKTEERLKSELQQINTAFSLMREHADRLQKLVQDSVGANEVRVAKLEAKEAMSQHRVLQMKISRLEEDINVLKENEKRTDKAHNDRIELHQKSVMDVRKTNAELERAFESQRHVAVTNLKKLENTEKILDEVEKSNRRLMTSNLNLTVEINNITDEFKMLLAQCVIQPNEMIYRTELESVKELAAHLTNQLSNTKAEIEKIQISREQELSHVRQLLKEREEQLLSAENQLIEDRKRFITKESDIISSDNVLGRSMEFFNKERKQLRNHCQYRENQLEELKKKISETETELAMKKAENESLSNGSIGKLHVELDGLQISKTKNQLHLGQESMMPKINLIFEGIPAATLSSHLKKKSDTNLYQSQQGVAPTSICATVHTASSWNATHSSSVSSIPPVRSDETQILTSSQSIGSTDESRKRIASGTDSITLQETKKQRTSPIQTKDTASESGKFITSEN